jgi:hypothetical protein
LVHPTSPLHHNNKFAQRGPAQRGQAQASPSPRNRFGVCASKSDKIVANQASSAPPRLVPRPFIRRLRIKVGSRGVWMSPGWSATNQTFIYHAE